MKLSKKCRACLKKLDEYKCSVDDEILLNSTKRMHTFREMILVTTGIVVNLAKFYGFVFC